MTATLVPSSVEVPTIGHFLSRRREVGGGNTGLIEVRKRAGIATPHAFMRRKCQSIILCSRVVRDSSVLEEERSIRRIRIWGSWERPGASHQRALRSPFGVWSASIDLFRDANGD